jgi:hypothetical protein
MGLMLFSDMQQLPEPIEALIDLDNVNTLFWNHDDWNLIQIKTMTWSAVLLPFMLLHFKIIQTAIIYHSATGMSLIKLVQTALAKIMDMIMP